MNADGRSPDGRGGAIYKQHPPLANPAAASAVPAKPPPLTTRCIVIDGIGHAHGVVRSEQAQVPGDLADADGRDAAHRGAAEACCRSSEARCRGSEAGSGHTDRHRRPDAGEDDDHHETGRKEAGVRALTQHRKLRLRHRFHRCHTHLTRGRSRGWRRRRWYLSRLRDGLRRGGSGGGRYDLCRRRCGYDRSSLFGGDTNNLGPRLGAAWDVGERHQTVLRANWGRFHDRNLLSAAANDIVVLGLLPFWFAMQKFGDVQAIVVEQAKFIASFFFVPVVVGIALAAFGATLCLGASLVVYDAILCEIATDKSSLEVESQYDGTLLRMRRMSGSTWGMSSVRARSYRPIHPSTCRCMNPSGRP